jgi:type VI secretion system protein ImpF
MASEERTILRSEGDRLQPALLDRLTDDDPGNTQEPLKQAVVSKGRLKRTVLRDIGWLLNTTAHHVSGELDDYPEVRRSVLNFGVPVLSGKNFSEVSWADLERAIHEALVQFEPRLLPESLRIRALNVEQNYGHHNRIEFEIRAELWSIPFPIELLLRSQLDLETRQVNLADQLGSAPAASNVPAG